MEKLKTIAPLVSTKWLNENMNHPDLVILDATLPKVGQANLSKEALTQSIPHARFFDLKNTFKDLDAALPNTMPSPTYFSKKAQELGINNQSTIVIYDHHGIYSSPRAWWMFRVMGHQNVAVLDGGFPAWKNENLPTQKTTPYHGQAGNFIANFQPHLLADVNVVLQSLNQSDVTILDARSEGRFRGTSPEPRAYLRSGHIPRSENLPISTIIKDGKMLPINELKKIYHSKNTTGKKLIFSCGSGITACVIALGAEMAGLFDKSVYDGSWTEWGAGEYPVSLRNDEL